MSGLIMCAASRADDPAGAPGSLRFVPSRLIVTDVGAGGGATSTTLPGGGSPAVAPPPGRGRRVLCAATRLGMPGACAELGELSSVELDGEAVVYVAGDDLVPVETGDAVLDWLVADVRALVVFDPGPGATDLEPEVLDGLLGRADVVVLDRRELLAMLGQDTGVSTPDGEVTTDPEDLAVAVEGLLREMPADGVLLLRDAPDGVWVVRRGCSAVHVPVPYGERHVPVSSVGGTHTGVFLAEIARGADLVTATRVANVAAAHAGADEEVCLDRQAVQAALDAHVADVGTVDGWTGVPDRGDAGWRRLSSRVEVKGWSPP